MASFAEIEEIFHSSFFDLIQRARAVHAAHWKDDEMQLCTLLSVKTGGCSEDCSYCAQSARYHTDVDPGRLMKAEEVMPYAHQAKENGATRFCMGAAWKGVRDGDRKFDQVLETVREVSKLGMEVCVTLGKLTPVEAEKLHEAGVTAYNHNINTSPEHYKEIATTHTFEDRLRTISAVQGSGMSLCCGGILGLGETLKDRLRMLEVLSHFDPSPESVPINCLVPIAGTPLEGSGEVDLFELVRQIATARIIMPKSKIRLAAGRSSLTREGQALCFFAGANSIFYGEKLLTTRNPESNKDLALLKTLNLKPQAPFTDQPHPHAHANANANAEV